MSKSAKIFPSRYFYFRAHNHPLGWGVGDAKADCVVAFGDKNICFAVAAILNGDPSGGGVLKGWPEAFDGWASALGAQLYKYDYETGTLVAKT